MHNAQKFADVKWHFVRTKNLVLQAYEINWKQVIYEVFYREKPIR